MTIDVHLQTAADCPQLPDLATLCRWIDVVVERLEHPMEMTVRFVEAAEGLELNARYRAGHSPTNVLSFPFEPPPGVQLATRMLGDLVICPEVVEREAAEQGKAVRAHFAHMVVHGTLHLLGYDHQSDQQARTMEAREVAIMARLGFPDPYSTDGWR